MKQIWRECGFADFIDGKFGNAGQNLYVSRSGILQRIHRFDLNNDGYPDIVICNSQNHWERPPAYVYPDPLNNPERRIMLPAEGALSGAVVDLNGDGYDDLILANHYNGMVTDLNANIYFGSPEGLSEKHQQQLPAPCATSVAAGDFNGDGRMDLAFLCQGKLRLFYQTPLGLEPKRFVDLDIQGAQLAAHDLDEDGRDELLVRSKEGGVRIFWGTKNGIKPDISSAVPAEAELTQEQFSEDRQYAEYIEDAGPLIQVFHFGGMHHIFVARTQAALLIPLRQKTRTFAPILTLDCRQSLSAAVGDVNGDGFPDLILACRERIDGQEYSWIFWGGPEGFDNRRKLPIATHRACDVAVGDLNEDGCAEIVFCQNHTNDSFTSHSLIYQGTKNGVDTEPVKLLSEDARRVFLVRGSKDARPPQVVLVNHFSREMFGNVNASIYYGGADGFTPGRRQDVPAWGVVEAICADINDDGLTDIVLVNASENSVSRDPGSFVYLATPAGIPNTPVLKLPTVRAHGGCCADINRDGYLDLVFCGFDNSELFIFYGSSGGFDLEHPVRIRLEYEGVVYKEPRWIYLADLNNDGWLDMVVPQIVGDRSFVLWGGPDGFSMQRCQVLSVVKAACARAADLTGNGYPDLIIGGHSPALHEPHDSFVYIYWNGPEGIREDRRTQLPGNGINAMAVADFNNDGNLDLFICSYHDGRFRDIDSYIYWNRRERGFSALDRTRLFTHSASGCLAADFNEDGYVDLAIAYHKIHGDHKGYSAVWWNGPGGFSEANVTRLPTSGPHGITTYEPGNLLDRGPEEYYVSSPFNLPPGAKVEKIIWEADIPAKTWVKAQLRFAASPDALSSAEWQGPGGNRGWFQNGQSGENLDHAGSWVQYRLALGAINGCGTPRVRAVQVEYDLKR